MRLSLVSPDVKVDWENPELDLSPNGQQVVFVASPLVAKDADAEPRQLYIRDFNDFVSKPISGTERSSRPQFSPNGRWIAFLSSDSSTGRRSLNRVQLDGSPAITICDITKESFQGFIWLSEDVLLLFGPLGGEHSSATVSVDGGALEYVDFKTEELGDFAFLRLSSVLPDGSTALGSVLRVMGTQARSAPYMHEAKKFVAEGGIGKVLFGKAWESARQGAIPKVADSNPPKGVDYDRWLGPAPKRPFNRYRFHGNWRWFFDYGCGDLGNDGVHRLDYCRMVMGIDQMPHTVSCSGGKLFFDDAQEWPDTMIAVYEFGGKPSRPKMIMTYEMRLWSKPKLHGVTEGGAVYGENGWVLMTNGKWAAYDRNEKVIKQGGDGSANQLHVRNFLDAVRSRRSGDLNQGIESGHISSALCHLGNIAWRTGRKFQFDAKSETTNDTKVNEYLGRQYRKGYELPREL